MKQILETSLTDSQIRHLIFDKTAKKFDRVRIVFSINGVGTIHMQKGKKNKTLNVNLIPSTNLNKIFF